MTRISKLVFCASVFMFWGCASDSTTTNPPTCPNILVDAGDYWGMGWCGNNGTNFPCCPDPLPTCDASSKYPACVREAQSNALCACCESSWTCLSDTGGS